MVSSHDVVVSVDAEHRIITEPWYEVRPEGGDAAILEVEFGEPDQPLMLGIEGAVGFIRSHDPDGTQILDRIVDLSQATLVEVRGGEQTVVVYYRT